MKFEDFCQHYDTAMLEAKSQHGTSSKAQTVISNGMDAACEALILSENYIDENAAKIATQALADIESDFCSDVLA